MFPLFPLKSTVQVNYSIFALLQNPDAQLHKSRKHGMFFRVVGTRGTTRENPDAMRPEAVPTNRSREWEHAPKISRRKVMQNDDR